MAFTVFHSFDVTIPAGTPKAAPVSVATIFPPNVVDSVEWVFPDGCNGQVGIQIGARTVTVIPADRTQFFVRSGSSTAYDLEDMPTNGDWSVIGYNTGTFPHTIRVTFRAHRMAPVRTEIMVIAMSGNALGTGES